MSKIDAVELAAYVVWVPRNGAREEHVDRVVGLVTDSRADQYWDARGAVIDPYDRMLQLTGQCAGIFALFGPNTTWDGDGPPRPDYLEDAHAKQFDRPWPQFDAKRFASRVQEMLDARREDRR